MLRLETISVKEAGFRCTAPTGMLKVRAACPQRLIVGQLSDSKTLDDDAADYASTVSKRRCQEASFAVAGRH